MTDEDQIVNLAPQDGDMNLCIRNIDPGMIREAVQTLRDIDNPVDARQATEIEKLHKSWAARGRELDRLRALLAVDLNEAVTAESELLRRTIEQQREALDAAQAREDEMRREHSDAMNEVQGRLNRTKDKANLFYRGWAAVEARAAAGRA